VVRKGKNLVSEEEIIKSLIQRKKWIDHLVITGGEPTLQPDLVEFCQKIKARSFKIKMDTNGSRPEIVEKLIKLDLVDFWAMDIKTAVNSYQFMVNSKKNSLGLIKNIKRSMKLIAGSGKDFEFRTTVVPGIHDEKVMKQMAKEILTGRWYWQKFVGRNCVDSKLNGRVGVTKREIERWRKGTGVEVELRGWL
jgi:pyruvate formate lyase activating enzyme